MVLARVQQNQPLTEEEVLAERERMQRALSGLVTQLQALADEQVQKKRAIEERWLEDERQFHGRYNETTELELRQTGKSRLFVNETRSKTLRWEGRIVKTMFPTDEKPWGIQPTPVPELTEGAKQVVENVQEIVDQANIALESEGFEASKAMVEQARGPAAEAAMARKEIAEAERRCKAMEREINDHLVEANFNIKLREGISDMCRLGTIVLEGPLTAQKSRKSWEKGKVIEVDPATGEERVVGEAWKMGSATDPRQDWLVRDPWNFFPDMGAARIEDAEFTFYRSLLNEKQLRKLAREPGFDKDVIRNLLTTKPTETLPIYIQELRDIMGQDTYGLEQRYHVWKYAGPITGEQLAAICLCWMKDSEKARSILADYNPDPLQEINVVIWFCQGQILKYGEYPLDSGECMYSVGNFVKDRTSIFGYGVPYIMRDPQAALNGAWRMAMDNAGKTAGPGIIIDRNQIEPMVGNSYEWLPWKVWNQKKSLTAQDPPPIRIVELPDRLNSLIAVINLALKFMDDETAMPPVAQGEGSGNPQGDTLGGLTLLQNAANVIFGHVVQNIDDQIIIPSISRAYEWEMMHSRKEEIKGDYEVYARGSSVLLVRELEAQRLAALVTAWTGHPVLGNLIKVADAARDTLRAQSLNPDKYIKSDEEIAQQEAEAAASAPQDPELLKLDAQMKIAEMEAQSRVRIAEMARDTAMMQLAAKGNMKLEELTVMLEDKDRDRRHKERLAAADIALTRQQMLTKANEPQPNISTTGTTQ